MPKFIYKAKDGPKKIVNGTVEANSVDNAIKKVMELGYVPVDVFLQSEEEKLRERSSLVFLPSFLKSIPASAIAAFTRQICDLVDASVPILRALQLVRNQTKNKNLRNILQNVFEHVKDGASFSSALNQHPDIFPKLYVHMVEAGEASGKLSFVLERLADLLEKEQESKRKVIASLAYPMFILLIGIVMMTVIFTFVIPKMTILFDDFDQQLPVTTTLLIAVSSFFAQYWYLIVGAAAMAFLYFSRMLRSAQGMLWFDSLKLRLPLLGDFIRDIETSRFARILGTLLDSGVVIIPALESVNAVIDNQVMKKELEGALASVANGASLRAALKECNCFTEMVVDMIAVGEETGNLEKGLYKIADTLERESERTSKTVISLLGPGVLVLIFFVIGFVVISLLLPILTINLV